MGKGRFAWFAGFVVLGACGDSIPLGPDLVACDCICTTQTATGALPGGCGAGTQCDPPCPGLDSCSVSGGCVPPTACAQPPPIASNSTSDQVTLHVCVDASTPSNAAQACINRCNDFASGSLLQCVDAAFLALGVDLPINDILPQSTIDSITPNAAQSVADILLEECGTWVLSTITGTCGLETHGIAALVDLLLCFNTIDTQGLNSGAVNGIRTCASAGASLEVTNGCPQFQGQPGAGSGTPVTGEPMPGGSHLESAQSSVSISGSDVTPATSHPQGTASTGRIGPVLIIGQLTGSLPDGTLTIKGHDVALAGGFLALEKPLAAVLGDPTFSIAPGKAHFIVSGKVDGQQTALQSTNVNHILGFYDEANGTFGLSGSLVLDGVDATVTIDLVFAFTNRPPQANAGTDQVVECTLPTREGVVQLTGAASFDPDPGDSIVDYRWVVGSQFIAAGPGAANATAHVGLGQRVASLVATDSHGSVARDVALIDVVDTQPPVFDALTVDPACLWPPNHKMVLLRLGHEIRADVHDACDPAPPAVFIKSVTSNQPAAGAPDIVHGTGAVCLRAERDGSSHKAPRVYTITVATQDSDGHERDQTVEVTVPHDQGGGTCPKIDPALIVDDDDPACAANVASAAARGPVSSALPSAAPNAAPNAAVGAAPGAAPNAAVGAAPDAAPNAAVGAAPDTAPNAAVEPAPASAGGCSLAGDPPFALSFVVALAALRRRRRA